MADEQSLTLVQVRAEFLRALAGRSERTAATYATALGRLDEFLIARGLDPAALAVEALPANLLEEFYLWLVRAYGREHTFTLATYVNGVRAFIRHLDRRGLLPPALSYERLRANLRAVMGRFSYRTPRVDRRLPLVVLYADQHLPPADAHPRQRLEAYRDRAILHTLFATGMRRAEVAALDRADVQDGWASQAIITGKGNKERVVFFTEEALAAIRDYLALRSDRWTPLFIRLDDGRGKPRQNGSNYRLSPQSIWNVVKRWASLAGVDATTHDFRHAKASTLLNRGAKLSEVQDILGHASPETTKRIYAHYETAHLRAAFDRFSASPAELAAELEAARRRGMGAGPAGE